MLLVEFQAAAAGLAAHGFWMSLAGAAVGFSGGLCAFRLRARMRHSRGLVRGAWVFMAGLAAGAGVWGADLLGLLAYRPDVASGFEALGALASLFLAVAGATAALGVAWSARERLRLGLGGALLALCAAGVRLMAVCSLRVEGRLGFEPIGLWFAVVASGACCVAALLLVNDARRASRQVAGAALFAAAALCLDLVGSLAMPLAPDPALALPEGLMERGVLGLVVAAFAGLMILGGMGAAYIDDVSSRSALQRTRRLADAAREGIVMLSADGRVVDCNAAFAQLADAPMAALAGRPLRELIPVAGAGLEVGRCLEAELDFGGGRTAPVELHARALQERGEHGEAALAVSVRDLRERRAAQDHIRFLAEHDLLTGLPNRATLNRAIAERLDGGLLLALVRLRNGAEITSLYGHAAHDAVLEKIAERLRRFVDPPSRGPGAMVARVGGSEFAVLAFGGGDAQEADVRELLARLSRSLRRPVVAEAHSIEPLVALGVSAAPLDARTGEELVRHAEVALETACRDEGEGGGVAVFRQNLQDELLAHRTLVADLKTGIAEDQFVVYYQPQVRAADGGLCGFEALVRWIHPQHGFMPPDRFIPAAEQSGLIVQLGEQVLRRACLEALQWPAPVPVAVNLSPLQVGQPDLPRRVHELLIETGLPPSRLELEITESALFRDFQSALDILRRLKALGVRIAMDDFGTGYSSLSTLKAFPFDKLKIDKSFVSGAGAADRSTVIIRAVLGIGKGLDIPVVAEGVETAEQMEFLREEGCSSIQGYLIGKPGPVTLHTALFEAATAPRRPATRPVAA